ncbi:glycosyltransferase family 4 protein [Gleimia sp. 6138-11-ORH1]|uniref:glycosyltransferase family 4 protein n=1 Tax=Gleimia sp. 6138-11-ORH1 TaxID=2973937 RepID=UPI002167A1DC|nr:glycosyltransferase family 4 protein [Gleimia sp. 6138-11-ORH1]MCS4484930.1 glycosyltransferase family 4 protein [Gleimia sp. 6138-11-ORH1]
MSKIGYVLKVYPRFSETFVVTEILARENNGETLVIFALRPTTDTRFHPEISKVAAEVKWVPRPLKPTQFWLQLSQDLLSAGLTEKFAKIWPAVAQLPADEVAQGVALAVAAKQENVTHLHAHFASLAGRTAWIASQLTGIPYTVTTHAKDIFHESVNEEWLLRIATGAAQVIAISKYNYAFLENKFRGQNVNLVLQYNALELARFPFKEKNHNLAAELQTRPLKVLAVGRLVEKKGFDLMLRAIKQLTDAGIDLDVKIAGEGADGESLKALADSLELGETVKFLGARTQAEVRDLLLWADVQLTPSVPALDGNLDGLPTVTLEAMAMGTLVIASDVTGLPEVVRPENGNLAPTGLLVPAGDLEALTAALKRVAEGDVNYTELVKNARELIETEFDSAQQARNLADLMKNGGELR